MKKWLLFVLSAEGDNKKFLSGLAHSKSILASLMDSNNGQQSILCG
jgi:hypothetical protein